ncbi:MAG: Ada metal-binding domain-containing protein [Desulfobacteraceae bacterium]|nr:MAG: Ada metal-binding domain-containing protein [Desulfobacteraceae bacterium]
MIHNSRLEKKLLLILITIALAVSISTGMVIGQTVTYHGNTQSRIFHQPSCRYYNCKKCTVEFTTREEAIAEGYRPCKVCKP